MEQSHSNTSSTFIAIHMHDVECIQYSFLIHSSNNKKCAAKVMIKTVTYQGHNTGRGTTSLSENNQKSDRLKT